MKKSLEVLSQFANKLSTYALTITLGLAFLSTVYQVFSRYVLLSPMMTKYFAQSTLSSFNFPWMEEFVRYLFIWTVFLGITVVYKMKGHAQVELVTNFLSSKWKRAFAIAVEIFNSLFFLILLIKGMDMLKITNGQLSPSLQINMAWMYTSMLCCAFICLIHSIFFLVVELTGGQVRKTDVFNSSMTYDK
jgi:TRAP-type C4-dicarboxylate transport system permease small subunit